MEASRRDATDEWVLPEQARPPLLSELEARIDHALATARSSEAAAIAVGSTALDAAEQARRSAELAERAHDLVAERLASQPAPAASQPGAVPAQPPAPAASQPGARPAQPPAPAAAGLSRPQPPPSAARPAAQPPSPNGPSAAGEEPDTAGAAHEEDPLHAFVARADRISARLQRLQRVPLATPR